ncbi:MAG TPA: mechanosensitive ion channel family protein [Rhizorhapis sp.]
MILSEWTNTLLESRWADALYVFLVVCVIIVGNALLKRGLRIFGHHACDRGSDWQAAILEAIGPPLRGMLWIVGLTFTVSILTQAGDYSLLSELFPPIRDVTTISLLTWFLLRMVRRMESNMLAKAHDGGLDPTATDAIGKLARIAIFVTAALVILQTLGFSVAGLLALGGAGGIAIGFAAQSLVANLLGGLTIYASRPFKVGEWIIMSGTEVMGEVQEIGWRATRIMGFDRKPFYVPNSMFNTGVVINHSRMTNRRIMEHMLLRYGDIDKVEAIVADVNRMLAEHPGIEHDFFAFNFDTCGDFALKLFLYAFTVSTDYNDYMNVKEDILLKIAALVRKHGGELAVPARTLHLPEGLRLEGPVNSEAEPFITGLSPARA